MNKKIFAAFFTVSALAAAIFYLAGRGDGTQSLIEDNAPKNSAPPFSVYAEGLDTPWALAVLPDGGLLVTERPGRVRYIDSGGNLAAEPAAEIAQAKEGGEGGLLGIALHPDFASNSQVYLYYTYREGGGIFNRIVKMSYREGKLSGEQGIISRIPGSSNHNGGSIAFGPDGYLYITTGDADQPNLAQNVNSLAGKILRVTDAGQPAPGNPFGNPVYSYGHRNAQGLAWDKEGRLWATEHGRSGLRSGLDEINLIEPGKNYGWPEIQGDETRPGMQAPIRHSGPDKTWAPAGAAFAGNSLFFAGLRGQTLYEAVMQNGQISEIKERLAKEFGRLRAVAKGPGNSIYVTTSNRDGRGIPKKGDDKVLLINF